MLETYGHDSNLNIINDEINQVLSDNENKIYEEKDESDSKNFITEIPFDFSSYIINFSKPNVLYW